LQDTPATTAQTADLTECFSKCVSIGQTPPQRIGINPLFIVGAAMPLHHTLQTEVRVMPSMVDNILTVWGPYDNLAILAQAARDRTLLQTIKPLSKEATKSANDTWGTSWDVQDKEPLLYDAGNLGENWYGLEMQFESPWAAPLGAYDELIDQGLMVIAYYLSTGGLEYGGKYIDGENQSYHIDELPDEIVAIFEETYDYDRLTAA
jgi:hypothetical protein